VAVSGEAQAFADAIASTEGDTPDFGMDEAHNRVLSAEDLFR
jgi:hypothetical protein